MNTTMADARECGEDGLERQARDFLRLAGGGACDVDWEEGIRASRLGGMVYLARMLRETGLFEELVRTCPLEYESNHAPGKARVLASVVVGILGGAWRYAHLSWTARDPIPPLLLGVEGGAVSEDSVRRAFRREPEWAWDRWLRGMEDQTLEPLLEEDYVLDLDTTIRPLYGHQEGAELGYNPMKPGRPSHAMHVWFIGALRLIAGVDVQGGKSHAARHLAPRLWEWIDELSPQQLPRLVRGDIGFGNEGFMVECERRGLDYLFKVRRSGGVKQLIQTVRAMGGAWREVSEGWQVAEGRLRLQGWSQERRVVVVREPARTARAKRRHQAEDLLPGLEWGEPAGAWVYAVLVTNMDLPAEAIVRLYRERADCENVLDELKNQWGLAGFVTHDLMRCRVLARLVALIYNWWNVFARLAEPREHMEAITSRHELLHLIVLLTSHGGRQRLRLCSHHENAPHVRESFMRVHNVFHRVGAIAGQLGKAGVWALMLSVAFYAWLKGRVLARAREGADLVHQLLPLPAQPALGSTG